MEELILSLPTDKCIEIIKNVIEELGWDIEGIKANLIRASTGFSIRSWGEIITIFIEYIEKDKTKLVIKSEPKAQLIDWGKSRENEIIFKKKMKKYLKDGGYL